MRTPTYTQDDIVEAASALLAQGKKVTGYALANVLGGGRPARLLSVWNEYSADKQEKSNYKLEVGLTEDFQESFDKLSNSLVSKLKSILIDCEQHISTKADERITKEHQLCLEKVAVVENKLEDANSVINNQEDLIEELLSKQDNFEIAQNTIAELEKQLVVLQTQIENHSSTLSDKERIISEQAARIDSLTALEVKTLHVSDVGKSSDQAKD